MVNREDTAFQPTGYGQETLYYQVKKRGKKKKKKRTEKNAVDNNKTTVCPRRGLKSAFLPFPRFWLKKFRQSTCIEKGKDIVIPVVHDVNFLVTESR